jgi:hypothetical protein
MDETRPSGIYFFKCRVTGKMYVGSGHLDARYTSHNLLLSRGTHYNKHFQRAWNKYGGEAGFEYGVIEECSRDLLRERETFWILYHRAAESRYGYNMAFPIMQRAPAERMSVLHRRRWKRPETRKKYEESSRKYWDSDEARDMVAHGIKNMAQPGIRERISQSVKENYDKNPELRVKIGEGAKRYFAVPENKKKRSEQSKAMWRDESTRKRILSIQKQTTSTSEYRHRMSVLKKQQWTSDPTIREKVSKSRKAQYQNDPEYVARVMKAAQDPDRNRAISEKAKLRWADPEFKSRVTAKAQATKLAKKLAKFPEQKTETN